MTPIRFSNIFEKTTRIKEIPKDQDRVPVFAEEIRQFLYCRRIIYWRRVADISGSTTYLMEQGSNYHSRRVKDTYERKDDIVTHRGRLFFHDNLKFGAKLDVCRELEDQIIPVEYKRFSTKIRQNRRTKASTRTSGGDRYGHVLQAMVGGLAAEYELQKPMRQLEIQYYPGRRSTISVSDQLRSNTISVIEEVQDLISLQILPDPTPHRGKCQVCEYKKVCHRV